LGAAIAVALQLAQLMLVGRVEIEFFSCCGRLLGCQQHLGSGLELFTVVRIACSRACGVEAPSFEILTTANPK
jgi:hypothetical protein